MLKIAIDTQPIHDLKVGVGLYAQQLIRNLERVDRKHEYLPLHAANTSDLNMWQRWRWDQIGVPRMAKELRADVLHQPVFSPPKFFFGPVVATVHDLLAIHFTEDISPLNRLYLSKWLPYSYRFADHLILLSEDIKRDMVKVLKISEKKLTVIYGAADLVFRPVHDTEVLARVRKKYGTGSRYLFHVGTSDSRGNLEFLIRVFAAVKKKVRTDWKLVIMGKSGRYNEQLVEAIRQLGLEHAVVLMRQVSDERDLPALYNAASICTFPSLYDGAARAPLEAMSCGVPTISSNTSSIPEIVGNGGILLSPTDMAGWTKALVSLMTDASLRREYGGRGRKQARRFSWERTARETVRVYDQVYREHLPAKRL